MHWMLHIIYPTNKGLASAFHKAKLRDSKLLYQPL